MMGEREAKRNEPTIINNVTQIVADKYLNVVDSSGGNILTDEIVGVFPSIDFRGRPFLGVIPKNKEEGLYLLYAPRHIVFDAFQEYVRYKNGRAQSKESKKDD